MDRVQEYIVCSLEQHLFFARIMKEHAFFLKAGLLPPNERLAGEGELLLRRFESLLARAIRLSDRVVRRCVLDSGEVVTEFTDFAECKTQQFTGIPINRELTADAHRLQGRCDGETRVPASLLHRVQRLNREALALLDRLIRYKERILQGVKCCNMFTVNYPLLIEHILREARLYRACLARLEGQDDCSCQDLRNSELFWNQIMMEHALFIRGLLDPSEDELIHTADDFAGDYKRLLESAVSANDRIMCDQNALALTRKFRDFKHAGAQGIAKCQIRAIILPLLADHVLREANHYIRLLEE